MPSVPHVTLRLSSGDVPLSGGAPAPSRAPEAPPESPSPGHPDLTPDTARRLLLPAGRVLRPPGRDP